MPVPPDIAPLPADLPRDTVALVIPLFNERDVLPLLIDALDAFRADHPEVSRVILVNDGSRDGTGALARELMAGKPGYTLVSFSRNFGHQLAVTAGLALVEEDAAVVLDADLQDPLDQPGPTPTRPAPTAIPATSRCSPSSSSFSTQTMVLACTSVTPASAPCVTHTRASSRGCRPVNGRTRVGRWMTWCL